MMSLQGEDNDRILNFVLYNFEVKNMQFKYLNKSSAPEKCARKWLLRM